MRRLPKGWCTTSLQEIYAQPAYGLTASADYTANGPKFLRITDIQNGTVNWDTVPRCDGQYADRFSVQKGDIVVARTGATTGKSYLIGEISEPSVFASYLVRVRAPEGINPQYLHYYLQTPDYWKQISDASSGSAQPGVNATKLANLKFPLAPSNEQYRITTKMDNFTGRTLRARAELDRIPTLIEHYKQAVLEKAFTGEFTAEWRHQNKPKPVSGNQNLIDGRAGDLPELPLSWDWGSLSQLADISGGLTKNARRSNLEYQVPYLRVANVYKNELRLDDIQQIGCSDTELKRTLLHKDDLLIVEGNGSIEQIGRVAIWDGSIDPCSHQNHLIRARPKADIPSSYILYWLLSNRGREAIERVASSSSGLHTLSISKVSGLPIPICTPLEMMEIVKKITTAWSWVDDVLSNCESASRLMVNLNQGLLTKAFRGELTPQDPADEPAEALLAQIRTHGPTATKPRRRQQSALL